MGRNGHGSATERWPRVLCIDDDPEISEVITLRLRQYEVTVLRAFHGMHGFGLAVKERPDLIICDLRMPQGDGDVVVACLRRNADTRSIPLIVLTGQGAVGLEAKMLGLGVNEFLRKPVLFDDLLSAIRRYVKVAGRRGNESLELCGCT